jgi:hypothetical protein
LTRTHRWREALVRTADVAFDPSIGVTPMRRMGAMEDVASVVLFFANNASAAKEERSSRAVRLVTTRTTSDEVARLPVTPRNGRRARGRLPVTREYKTRSRRSQSVPAFAARCQEARATFLCLVCCFYLVHATQSPLALKGHCAHAYAIARTNSTAARLRRDTTTA